ncbi:MAG: polymer-forming cytoskeletal protein [Tindallia sp. MSAO_Bac2]|nr:MAG: polymer-forming cytoskeletal protein [Tindallia sp. MSAO_Bac2]
MFNKKQEPATPQFDNFDTLIGKKSEFEGTIKAQDPIRIDGVLTGEIISEADIVIGEGAEIKGNIQCKNILLAGTANGNIQAAGRLHITSTGALYGDASIYSFIVDEKGIFDGGCHMRKSEEAKPDTSKSESSNEKNEQTGSRRNSSRKNRS